MSDLIAEKPDPFDRYRSHSDKFLRVHMNGVLRGVQRRTCSKTAIAAALFHDLGKLNPNFKFKLDGETVPGYSSHAYLSAHIFLCYCKANPKQLVHELEIATVEELFSVLAQIARHHGNLSNFEQILNQEERKRMFDFLATQPDMPASDFLQQWLPHQSFDMLDERLRAITDTYYRMSDCKVAAIKNKLEFFLETQHSFSCLLEADKRDASNNDWFQRQEHLDWARQSFTPQLSHTIGSLLPRTELDMLKIDCEIR